MEVTMVRFGSWEEMGRRGMRPVLLALAAAVAIAGCGSSDGDPPAGATELAWNGTPLPVTLAAGSSRTFFFVYPTSDGSPSAQFGAVTANPFDVHLCRVSDCGPAFPSSSVTPKVTLQTGCEVSANCQIYDPVTPTVPTTYWVHVTSAVGTSFTIWAEGT